MNYSDYRNLGFTVLSNGLIAYYSHLDISDQELVLLLQLEAFFQRGEFFPTNEKLSANTNFNVNEISALIQQLINKKYISIEQTTDSYGRIGNRYNLNNLYNRLDNYLKDNIISKATEKENSNSSSDTLDNNPLNRLSRQFEVEFGRYLSPIEREELASWLNIDHYKPEIIELALREAVLSQAYSLKYVDRILLNWQRHNLKTVTEIKRFLQRNR